MTNDEFMKLCKQSVADYFNGRKDSTDKNDPITEDNVFIVWMCKTLQNHKAMVSTLADLSFLAERQHGETALNERIEI